MPVQPDIVFIRKERHAIIGKENVEGAPDLIVEILSPSNWTFDRKQKFQAYREAGVNEYWIVDYRKKTVESFCWNQVHTRFWVSMALASLSHLLHSPAHDHGRGSVLILTLMAFDL